MYNLVKVTPKEGITMITLTKKKDRDFTVLNLTDPQLLTHEWEREHVGYKVLTYTVNKLISEIKPDLITVSGDISVAEYPEAYTNFAKFIDTFDIPWAVVWGNTEHIKTLSTKKVRKSSVTVTTLSQLKKTAR